MITLLKYGIYRDLIMINCLSFSHGHLCPGKYYESDALNAAQTGAMSFNLAKQVNHLIGRMNQSLIEFQQGYKVRIIELCGVSFQS